MTTQLTREQHMKYLQDLHNSVDGRQILRDFLKDKVMMLGSHQQRSGLFVLNTLLMCGYCWLNAGALAISSRVLHKHDNFNQFTEFKYLHAALWSAFISFMMREIAIAFRIPVLYDNSLATSTSLVVAQTLLVTPALTGLTTLFADRSKAGYAILGNMLGMALIYVGIVAAAFIFGVYCKILECVCDTRESHSPVTNAPERPANVVQEAPVIVIPQTSTATSQQHSQPSMWRPIVPTIERPQPPVDRPPAIGRPMRNP